jgi:hypothetical protein
MNFLNLFPTVVLQETLNLDLDLLEKYKSYITNSEFIKHRNNFNITTNQQILNNSLFSDLLSSVIYYSKIYLKNLGHEFTDLQISSSWGISFNKGGYGDNHAHANSYISGVFYISKGSPLVLSSPLDEKWSFSSSSIDKSHYQIFPSPNLLLIFPSWLHHHILPSIEEGRTSIAFNIIPKGEFGGETAKLYL